MIADYIIDSKAIQKLLTHLIAILSFTNFAFSCKDPAKSSNTALVHKAW